MLKIPKENMDNISGLEGGYRLIAVRLVSMKTVYFLNMTNNVKVVII